MRALRAGVARADEGLEGSVAVDASIFVDRHAFSSLVERLRVFDQDAAGGLGMQKADHAGQAVARLLID